MLAVLFIGLVVGGLILGKSKVYGFVVIIFMSLLVGLCTTQADYSFYKATYDYLDFYPSFLTMELGWQLLYRLGNEIGISYNVFICIMIFISGLLLRSTIELFSLRSPFAWALFLIFPMLIGLAQVRQTVALGLLIYAIRYLLQRKKLDLVKYVALVLMATMIHTASIIFLVFLLIPFVGKHEKKSVIIITVIVVLCIIFRNEIISLAGNLFPEAKVSRYLQGNAKADNSVVSQVVRLGFMMGGYVLARLSCDYFTKNHSEESRPINAFMVLNKNLNLVLLILTPIVLLNADLMRIQRLNLITSCIAFSNVVFIANKDKRGYALTCINVLFVGSSALVYIVMPFWDSIVVPLLGIR